MTNFEPWLPPADPNAQTRALPWSPAAPAQTPIEETRVFSPGDSDADLGVMHIARPEKARGRARDFETAREGGRGTWSPEAPAAFERARRTVNRRRVLFAAGGLMLLAGGGVATATAAGSRSTQATGGGAGTRPIAGSSGSTSAAASHSSSHSASSSASSAASSNSPSAQHSASASSPASSSAGSSSGSGTVYTQPQWYVDDQGPKAIALTLDDGPDPTYTPQVLEILRRYNIKATFNMVGQHIAGNLSVVREVSAAGHTITNHTWNHADLTHCTYSQVLSQMDRCNDALANANQHPTIFRAPYGNWSTAVFQACTTRHLKPVGWSVDPRDWDTTQVDTQQIVQNVLRSTRAHDIILEHDGGGPRRNTIAALKIFIPELIDRGFNFVAM